ncbi:MAG TPA: S9 family peptidase [Caulobacteraceae bacterium]|jgi:dipeptidyl aminopeptidase/acylaminoacyl peptidase
MIALLAAAAVAAQATPAPAPSAPPVRQYHDLALSPSGDKLAAVEQVETGQENHDMHPALVVRSTRDGQILASYDPCPTCRYFSPAWSPNGDSLAVMAVDQKQFAAQLIVIEQGKPRTAATFSGVGDQTRWSPDGKSIAFLATVGARKLTGATQAGIPLTGEIGETNDEQRIAIVPATGGADIRFASPADTFVYEYGWTPDGRGFVGTAAKGNGDNNWWVAKIEAFDAATGAARIIASPKTQANYPRVTADGKSVIYIGGLMSDFGPVGGDLWSAPFAGGEPVDVTPNFKGTFTSLSMTGGETYATVLAGDQTELVTLDPVKGPKKIISTAAASFGASAFNGRFAFDASGRMAATEAQDFEHAPILLAGPVAAMKQITHDNDAAPAFVSARSVTWKNEGFDVQGWLIGPRDVTPGKTYPMIVQVHGGPSAAAAPNYLSHGTVNDLVAHGYYVFEPNPRGSYGQGEAFTRANVRDFGGGDLRDILAGVDAVEKFAPIDDKRLGIYGHSYGGLMTMWTVTQSQRFHAAVAGAGIANWTSYYGENGIDEWMIPFFGASFYDDPAIYEKLSPIFYIKNAHTPTFIYVGERDVECPAPQSLEYWHGLKAMGVETSLVIYPGEGHGIRKPEHVHDLADRIVGWFDKHLGS